MRCGLIAAGPPDREKSLAWRKCCRFRLCIMALGITHRLCENFIIEKIAGDCAQVIDSRGVGPMRCSKCGSDRVRRSMRRGIYESLILRLIRYAPFRCFGCGSRFVASQRGHRFGQRKKRASISSYLGYRASERHEPKMLLGMFAAALTLMLAVVWLILRLVTPSLPPPAP